MNGESVVQNQMIFQIPGGMGAAVQETPEHQQPFLGIQRRVEILWKVFELSVGEKLADGILRVIENTLLLQKIFGASEKISQKLLCLLIPYCQMGKEHILAQEGKGTEGIFKGIVSIIFHRGFCIHKSVLQTHKPGNGSHKSLTGVVEILKTRLEESDFIRTGQHQSMILAGHGDGNLVAENEQRIENRNPAVITVIVSIDIFRMITKTTEKVSENGL